MTSIRYCLRLGAPSLVCLYVVVFNGLVWGAPPTDDSESTIAPMGEKIAGYATNAICRNNLEAMLLLYVDAEEISSSLYALSLTIGESNDSPEVKASQQKECDEYRENLKTLIPTLREYVNLRDLFNNYLAIMDEFHAGDLTYERMTELSEAVLNLEQEFEGKEELAENMIGSKFVEYVSGNIRQVEEFLAEHRAPESLESNKPAEPSLRAKTPSPSATSQKVPTNERKSAGDMIKTIIAIKTMTILSLIAVL
ncbi:hypothetical protein BBBOND_0104410 [Babesia bigemina]|uniref:Uncharacterized protein n=1 Tax=Babesia bigemina TaxID=5866 RepID=A0A061D1Y2_BABBI|nr:hypothetical protein BBBOND_0104410 [Babesia bigemina]CDR94132.1 hypothetical protein BBBOND_0104410 [Babesia bigemina]|eukprot:XP_012766318.1 hypothetical protein BBBOND_0104410 [Babesia bigemina]